MPENRYIRTSDPKLDAVGTFHIQPEWWSRGYEYAWALEQARSKEAVMDAGCGIGHPLKYALAKKSRRVVAVDSDKRIERLAAHPKIRYVVADLADTGVKAESIHTVYCISVIEHFYTREKMAAVWQEWARVLKPGGRVIITTDIPWKVGHPRVTKLPSPQELVTTLPSELAVEGETDFERPDDAIYDPACGLTVFRLLLRKEE